MKKIALITISLWHRALRASSTSNYRLILSYVCSTCISRAFRTTYLVSDRQRVKAYLNEELSTTTLDDLMPWNYEPCGIDSNYYRVSIRTIKESVISEDLLLDVFIRSANSKKRPTVESWRDRWNVIIGTIDQMQLGLSLTASCLSADMPSAILQSIVRHTIHTIG